MTVTLIVSSAIYGLLTAGGNAFRREPEVADRQQNIRAAMDVISRDVFGAGAATAHLRAGLHAERPGRDLRRRPQQLRPGRHDGPRRGRGARRATTENTDVLEIVSTDEQCPQLGVCSTAAASPIPGVAGLFVTQESLPQCLNVPGLVLMAADTAFTLRPRTPRAAPRPAPRQERRRPTATSP